MGQQVAEPTVIMVAKSRELWFNGAMMSKQRAIDLLGGTVPKAAEAIGVTYQAVEKWPDPLPRRIEDRVVAAVARKLLPAATLSLLSDASAKAN